jgi:hypothetical protein
MKVKSSYAALDIPYQKNFNRIFNAVDEGRRVRVVITGYIDLDPRSMSTDVESIEVTVLPDGVIAIVEE